MYCSVVVTTCHPCCLRSAKLSWMLCLCIFTSWHQSHWLAAGNSYVCIFGTVRQFFACCRAQSDLEQERNGRIEAEDVVSRLKAQLREVRVAEEEAREAAEQTLEQLQQEFGAAQQVSAAAVDCCQLLIWDKVEGQSSVNHDCCGGQLGERGSMLGKDVAYTWGILASCWQSAKFGSLSTCRHQLYAALSLLLSQPRHLRMPVLPATLASLAIVEPQIDTPLLRRMNHGLDPRR